MKNIHPTSIISPLAKIDPSVLIGPFCVIGDNVRLEKMLFLNLMFALKGIQ